MWLNGKTNYISAVEIRGPEKSILDESDWTKTRSECLGSTVQLNYWVDFWYLWVEKWRWVHWTDVWNWHYVLENLGDEMMKKDGIIISQSNAALRFFQYRFCIWLWAEQKKTVGKKTLKE